MRHTSTTIFSHLRLRIPSLWKIRLSNMNKTLALHRSTYKRKNNNSNSFPYTEFHFKAHWNWFYEIIYQIFNHVGVEVSRFFGGPVRPNSLKWTLVNPARCHHRRRGVVSVNRNQRSTVVQPLLQRGNYIAYLFQKTVTGTVRRKRAENDAALFALYF